MQFIRNLGPYAYCLSRQDVHMNLPYTYVFVQLKAVEVYGEWRKNNCVHMHRIYLNLS